MYRPFVPFFLHVGHFSISSFSNLKPCALILFFLLLLPDLTIAGNRDDLGIKACSSSEAKIMQPKPRLYLSKSKLSDVRLAISNEPMSRVWSALLEDATKDLKILPEKAINKNKMKVNMPDLIPRLILVYFITEDSRYFDHALLWLDAYGAIDDWGGNEDLVASHALFSMSVAYDWLYKELDDSRRQIIKDKIVKHASIFYNLMVNDSIWWSKSLLQNHNYTNTMALAIAGVSLHGECAEADLWLAAAEDNFLKVSDILSPDGATHEGVGYWGYGMSSMLNYIYGVHGISPNESLVGSQYMKNTAMYRLHMSLPGFRENANYSDSNNFEWYGPGYILRGLAALYKDPNSQWLADAVEIARAKDTQTWLDKPKYSWQDLLWYDKTVGRKSPDDLSNYAFFDSLGFFVYRKDWSETSSWLLYKTGPPQGWYAYGKGVSANSHIHPDAGQILYFSGGKWLLRDDSYVNLKLTKNHNVILVNKSGQYGEGGKWFRGGRAFNNKATTSLLKKELNSKWQLITADITKMYPQKSGLEQWYRSVITMKYGVVLISDDIKVRGKSVIDTLFHLDSSAYLIDDRAICLDGENKKYVLAQIYPDTSKLTIDTYKIPKQLQHSMDTGFYSGNQLRIRDEVSDSVRKIYILSESLCDAGIYNEIYSNSDGRKLTIKSGKLNYHIDLNENSIKYE